MTNPVTQNIGLNKIDRTSPSTTYFDLEKYIDQNADAVDRFAGETSEAIDALEKRLDTEKRREVVLQPGLQIVNVERSAPFKLSGIKGRTLVNLLGRDGDCESISGWTHNTSTISIDVSNKVYGSNSLKVTVISGGNGQGTGYRQIAHLIDRSKYYVAVVDVKSAMGAESRLVLEISGKINVDGTPVTDTEKFTPSFLGIKPSDIEGTGNLVLHGLIRGSVGDVSYFDGFRIYEITQSEYNKLGAMTAAQVAAKYPYVDSVQPVRSPYAIRHGENLLPPFYEASFAGPLAGFPYVESPYEGRVNAAGVNVGFQYWIPCVPNTEYTLTVENDGLIALQDMDKDKVLINNNGGFLNAQRASIVTANNAAYLHILMSSGPKGAGTYTFKNPMLTIGTEFKRFKPRNDSMLALQTDLFADPSTGTNADEVFEKDWKYFKLTKWGKATLTDNFNYVGVSGVGAGWKQTYFDLPSKTAGPYSEIIVKHDGKILQSIQITDGPDIGAIDSGNAKRCYISFSNADTGWGDNYTPTTDEIKAYFMGWKMYFGGQADVSQPYNGTGSKAWCPLDSMYSSGSLTYATHYTSTLPTASTTTLSYSRYTQWTPYKLIYQLATPTIEPIVSEGMLTFNEGDNQIEVGSGIVIRESVVPQRTGDAHVINDINLPGSILNHKVERFLNVYKNGYRDQWEYRSNVAYGSERRVKYDSHDITAAYSVTYLMLDKSPFVPFPGSYAVNEKSILQELTDAVHQNATVVSVLMNKKADKDIPGWITPTLLNGWKRYNLELPVRYKKQNGIIYISGRVSDGAVGYTTKHSIFILPAGFRPIKTMYTTVNDASYNSRYVAINPDGYVNIETGGNININLDGISFPAEQ